MKFKRLFPVLVLSILAPLPLVGCGHGNQRPPLPSDDGKALMAQVREDSHKKLLAQAFDTVSADQRRKAIAEMSQEDWGKQEPCLKAYAMLAKDPQPIVRATAISALHTAGSPAYAQVLIDALEHDPVEYVRVDAADGLTSIVAPAAVEPLIKHAKSDTCLDIRLRSLRGLKNYPQKPVLDALLVCLGDEEFGIRFTARQSLAALIGQDDGYDVNKWTKTISAKGDAFAKPAPKAVQKAWWRF